MSEPNSNSTLYGKLFVIQGLSVKKDAKGVHNAKYATLDNVIETLTPLLKEHKLLITHRTEDKQVITSVIDIESGEREESKFPLIETNDPQKYGSCITYAKRYNLGQLLNIITDPDDDGDSLIVDKTVNNAKSTFNNSPDEDNKAWYNDFDKHEDALHEEVAAGADPKDILNRIRKQYKVSKKTAEQITSLK